MGAAESNSKDFDNASYNATSGGESNFDFKKFVATVAQNNDEDVNNCLCNLWNITLDELTNKLDYLKIHGTNNDAEIKVLASTLDKITSSNNDMIVSESLEPNKVDYSKFGIVTSISDILLTS